MHVIWMEVWMILASMIWRWMSMEVTTTLVTGQSPSFTKTTCFLISPQHATSPPYLFPLFVTLSHLRALV